MKKNILQRPKFLVFLAILITGILVFVIVFALNQEGDDNKTDSSSSSSSVSSSIVSESEENISEELLSQESQSPVTFSEFEKLVGLEAPLNKNFVFSELKKPDYFDPVNYIPTDCTIANSDSSQLIKLFQVKEEGQTSQMDIAEISCFYGAYNTGFKMLYFPDGFNQPETKQLIPVYSYRDEGYFLPETEDLIARDVITNIFDYDYLSFKSLAKSRGIGDCGIFYQYQFVPEKIAIYPTEERDRACTDEPTEVTTYESWDLTYQINL